MTLESVRQFVLQREGMFAVLGCVSQMWTRCGRPNCRCAKGAKHGPYFRLWWGGGAGHSKYLGREDAGRVARQTLLEVRQKRWSGYTHVWKYQRGVKEGLRFLEQMVVFGEKPTLVRGVRMLRSARKLKLRELERAPNQDAGRF